MRITIEREDDDTQTFDEMDALVDAIIERVPPETPVTVLNLEYRRVRIAGLQDAR